MKKYGLLGEHLGHSLSVPIHRLFFQKTGIPGSYALIEVAPERLDAVCGELACAGYEGLNVTIPYKQAVMARMDDMSDAARRIGAVNTVALSGRRMTGHNTDGAGFRALLQKSGVSVRGGTVALLGGSGGAAQAIRCALFEEGASRVYLVSRANHASPCDDPRAVWIGYDDLRDLRGALLVNATPVGMKPRADASPVPSDVVAHWDAVVDAIYNPETTLLLQYAGLRGKTCANGLYMLVAQAVRAQEIWQGARYGAAMTDAIYADLRALIAEGSVVL